MKFLKQAVIFLVFILMVSFVATSCDKTSTESTIADLYGTWNLLSTSVRITVNGIVISDTTETPGENEYTHVTLKEDGTYTAEDLEGGVKTTETGTVTIKDDSLTINIPDEDPMPFHWKLTGDILTLQGNSVVEEQGITGEVNIEVIFKKMN